MIRQEEQARSARLLAIEQVVFAEEKSAEEALFDASQGEDLEVALAASRALYQLKSEQAGRALMGVAQRTSRDRHYEIYLEILPMLAELHEPWIHLYLETVAEAHRLRRVRESVRSLLEEPKASVE